MRVVTLSVLLLGVGLSNVRADCSMTSLGAPGIYTIATLSANLSGCPGILTIPAGYTLNLNSTAALPAGITEIYVLTGTSSLPGGIMLVSVDYSTSDKHKKPSRNNVFFQNKYQL